MYFGDTAGSLRIYYWFCAGILGTVVIDVLTKHAAFTRQIDSLYLPILSPFIHAMNQFFGAQNTKKKGFLSFSVFYDGVV